MGACLPIARLCLELRTCQCGAVVTKCFFFPIMENVEMLAKENRFHLQPYLIEIVYFHVFASSLFLTRCFCINMPCPQKYTEHTCTV